jgi:hypothetical protein
MSRPTPREHLDFLLSVLYDRRPGERHYLHPPHADDLAASGISDATIARQKIRDVPPHMIDLLLGSLCLGPPPGELGIRRPRSARLFSFPSRIPAAAFGISSA